MIDIVNILINKYNCFVIFARFVFIAPDVKYNDVKYNVNRLNASHPTTLHRQVPPPCPLAPFSR